MINTEHILGYMSSSSFIEIGHLQSITYIVITILKLRLSVSNAQRYFYYTKYEY